MTDAEFQAVHATADATLRDAMDIALLTGQRPADTLKIQRVDIRDGALFVAQNKTGAKRAIEVSGELAQVIERIHARQRQRLGAFLIQDDNGRPLSTALSTEKSPACVDHAHQSKYSVLSRYSSLSAPGPFPENDHKQSRIPGEPSKDKGA